METCPKCHLADDVSHVDGTLTCGRCSTVLPDQELVWVSGGGNVYHRNKGCASLLEGQVKVERRGGDCAPVLQRTRAWSQAVGRAPCWTCTPCDWRS